MRPTIRCSELDRLFSCFGARVLAALVRPRKGDEGAVGTSIHAWIARELCAKQGATAGNEIPVMPFKLTGFDAWVGKFCYEEVAVNCPAGWSLEVEGEFALARLHGSYPLGLQDRE